MISVPGAEEGAARHAEETWEYPFPEGVGSDAFMAAFKKAVVPEQWRTLRSEVWPLLLLDTGDRGDSGGTGGTGECGDSAAAAARRAHRVLQGLADALGGEEDKRVAYARPQLPQEPAGSRPPAPDRPPEPAHPPAPAHPPEPDFLTVRIGSLLESGTPPEAGRLRLRNLRLMTELVRWAQQVPGDADLKARTLRNHLYDLRAGATDGGLPHLLARLSRQQVPALPEGQPAAAQSTVELVWTHLAGPLLFSLPRCCWSTWWSWRLVTSKQGWYARWRPVSRSGSFFDKAAQFLRRQIVRLRKHDDPAAERAALRDFEELLLRALLADLHQAGPGRFLPWRRRRRTRPVVLLDLPAAGTPAEAATRRFLDTYQTVQGVRGSASLLVVGAGAASDYTDVRWRRCRDLKEAVRELAAGAGPAPQPLVGALPQQDFTRDGMLVHPVEPPEFWSRPATELACELGAGCLALGLLANFLWPVLFPPPPDCLNGAVVTGQAQPRPVPAGAHGESPREQYDDVLRSIGRLNRKALYAERTYHKPVRRVVYLGTGVADDPDLVVMNGAIPELRGIWLAQAKRNEDAMGDPDRVLLYVDVRDTGTHFENVVGQAHSVVRQAAAHRDDANSNTVVGVVGFRESRQPTQAAAKVLNDGKVPVIGTTATADAMQSAGDYYRPMSPDNSRESRIAAEFARQGRIIQTGPQQCATADRAVVVKDPGDLYSNELGTEFAQHFGGSSQTTLEFPGRPRTGVTAQDTAQRICDLVHAHPRTVVYWTSRVNAFNSFMNSYGPDSGCSGRALTVIGGNELTNAALGGQYLDKVRLRLYHTVHVLPDGHPEENDQARQFIADYIRAYTAHDPWINDGHEALAHDALWLLSLAADREYASNHNVTAEGVKSKLDEGVHFQGVSGDIDIRARHGSAPPLNKALVMLYHTREGQKLVLYCGAFRQDEGPVTRWGPDQQYACPQDAPD